jgi:hypothetical protein
MIARCKKLKTTQAAEKLQKQGIHAADLFPASVSITLLLAHNRSNRKKSSKHSSSSKKKIAQIKEKVTTVHCFCSTKVCHSYKSQSILSSTMLKTQKIDNVKTNQNCLLQIKIMQL